MVKRKYFKKFFAVTLAVATMMSTVNLQGVTARATDDVTSVESTEVSDDTAGNESTEASDDTTGNVSAETSNGAVSVENMAGENNVAGNDSQQTTSYGYVDNGYVAPRLDVTENNSGLNQAISIPAKYDSRDYGYVTPVRNQGAWGTCWAFAAVASMESAALSHGVATDKDTLDISEYNVAYMAFNDKSFVDPLGGTDGDNTFTDDMTTALQTGGNQSMVFRAMSKWAGMVDESDCAYPIPLVAIYKYDASKLKYILTGVRQVNMQDRDYVKKAVMENGAASMYYYDSNEYANNEYYYDYVSKATNHAVTIIGWDDNISKEKFKTTDSNGVEHMPEGDGAWLIKNSWGKYNYRTNGGYMWISYYNVASYNNGNATFYEVAKADTYDYNYQYDGNTQLGYGLISSDGGDFILANKYANVFTVKAGTGAQKLDAVAFGVKDANTSYSIQIYKNPTLNTEDSDGNFTGTDNPESGTPLLSEPVTGSTTFAGYYTVNLPSVIKLNEGDTFAVVITFDDATSMDYSYYFPGSTGVTSVSHNNESYYAPSGKLVDLYEGYLNTYNINMCIKAFTTKVSDKLSTPQITKSEVNNDSVQLEWQSVEGAEGYELFRSNAADGTYSMLGSFNTTSYTDNAVSYGNSYYYKVRAYKTVNGVKEYSDYSTRQSASIDLPVAKLDIETNNNAITLKWDSIAGAKEYNIYKRSESDNQFKKIKTVTANSYTENVEYNISYQYYVTCVMTVDGISSESMKSNTVDACILTKAPDLKADTSAYGKVKLSWNATDGTEVYRLYVYNRELDEYDILKEIKSTDKMEYVDDNLENAEGTTRQYMLTTYTVKDGNMLNGDTAFANAFVRHSALENLSYTLDNGILTLKWDSYAGVIGRYGYYSIYSSDKADGEYKLLINRSSNSYTIQNYDDSKDLFIKIVTYGSTTGKDESFGNYYDVITAMQETPLCIKGKTVLKGWQKIDNIWYYYNSNGVMQTSKWIKSAGKWYYVGSDGAMQTSKWISGKYYVKANGTMAMSELVDNGRYYVDSDGIWVKSTKWLKLSGKWYYIKSGTVQKSKWLQIGNKWYYFDKNGIMQTSKWIKSGSKWYYVNADGVMQTSKWISGVYYVKANGTMAVSEWVDGGKYYVGADGKWIKNYKK